SQLPTVTAGREESSSLYAELGLSGSDMESDEEMPLVGRSGTQDEGQAGSDPGILDEGQAGLDPGTLDEGQAGSDPGTDISQKDEWKNQAKSDKTGHGMEKCVKTKPNQSQVATPRRKS
ncbi:hypothetical protein Tco_0274696, partial [Tanacetum coccineum]